MPRSKSKRAPPDKIKPSMTPEQVWAWYQRQRKRHVGASLELTPEERALVRLAMKVVEHRNAIAGAREALPIQGEAWVKRVVSYHEGCLFSLGVEP